MIEITIKKKAVRGSIMKSTFPVIGDSSTVLISGIPLIKTATAGNIIVRADKKEKIEQTLNFHNYLYSQNCNFTKYRYIANKILFQEGILKIFL